MISPGEDRAESAVFERKEPAGDMHADVFDATGADVLCEVLT
jgi:hypothetical protein